MHCMTVTNVKKIALILVYVYDLQQNRNKTILTSLESHE